MSAGYSSLKILLVEDNQHMRAIVIALMRSVGFRHISEVKDGAEAFEELPHIQPDIILVDFNMTPIDGVEFTRMVRASQGQLRYVPIIMITGHSQRSRVEEARDAGITEFIGKPLTATSLISRLNNVIMNPRPFIKCATYFGPDRRRRQDTHYVGPLRRSTDGR